MYICTWMICQVRNRSLRNKSVFCWKPRLIIKMDVLSLMKMLWNPSMYGKKSSLVDQRGEALDPDWGIWNSAFWISGSFIESDRAMDWITQTISGKWSKVDDSGLSISDYFQLSDLLSHQTGYDRHCGDMGYQTKPWSTEVVKQYVRYWVHGAHSA